MSPNNVIIFNFLKRFASFESTLKISTDVRIKDNGNVEWGDVKRKLKEKGFTFDANQRQLEIILNPPRKPFYKNAQDPWTLGQIDSDDYGMAIDVLVRVRNNLFHGSKKFGDSSECERNIKLIDGALIILNSIIACLELEDAYLDIMDYWN